MPCGASVSGASGPPGLAATGITGALRNLKQNNKHHDSHRGITQDRSVELLAYHSSGEYGKVTPLLWIGRL